MISASHGTETLSQSCVVKKIGRGYEKIELNEKQKLIFFPCKKNTTSVSKI